MNNRFSIIISCFFALSAAISANAQKLSTLAPDGSVTFGKLPDGLQYAIVTSAAEKGRSEYALLQRACQNEKGKLYNLRRFGTFSSVRGGQSQDSILFRMISAVKESIEECDSLYGTDNQILIITGDVDRNASIEKLRLFSYMVPESRSKAAWSYPYRWEERPLEAEVFPEDGFGVAQVRISFFSPRPRQERMNTIIPTVSEVMMKTLGEAARRRLEDTFSTIDLPVSCLSVSVTPLDMTEGDPSLEIGFAVGEDNLEQAIAVVSATLSDLGNGGLGKAETLQISDAVIERLRIEAGQPVTNGTWLRRVVSNLITGTDLATPSTKLKLFTEKEISDSTIITSINSIASATFGRSDNILISVSGGTMTPAAIEKTYEGSRHATPPALHKGFVPLSRAGLPEASTKKYKPKKSISEKTFGGTEFQFANGLRVMYRQMPTNGRLYWSAVLGGGTSSLEGAVAGESAYLADIFRICRINGYEASGFLRLMESKGMTAEADVRFNDCIIHGVADSKDPDLFFRFLLSILNGRSPEEKAYQYYEECEGVGSRIYADVHVMERLESELRPGFAFSEYKVHDILADDFYERAGRYYEKRFSRMNDGALIVVGDISEFKFLSSLRMYADQFRTSPTKRAVNSVSYRIISGERTFPTDFDLPSARIVASGLIETTLDNRLATDVADRMLAKVLSSALQDSGWKAESSITFNSAPKGHVNLRIHASHDTSYGGGNTMNISELKKTIMRELKRLAEGHFQTGEPGLSKSEASTALAQKYATPEYWLWVGEGKVIEAKDYNTSSAERLSKLTDDRIRKIFSALYDGGRIIL